MSSILTNNGAMVALQTLKTINKDLGSIQSQISTGKSVATSKDNAAVWAISKQMDSDVKGFKAISSSLALGESTVAVARNASETVTDLLTEIKGKVVSAQEENVDRGKIQTDIEALTKQIESVVGAAQFNGLNLINGSAGADPVNILASLDRSSDGTVESKNIEVSRQNLSTGDGGGLAALTTIDVSADGGPAAALAAIETMITTAIDASAEFGSAQGRIEIQADFVGKLTDSLRSGIGSLVDADMEEASARLQALQTQQQLGVQSLSIANQAPQSILSLFR